MASPSLVELPTATLVEYRRVLKYSPDQPRDDHGRWSSDGQSAAVYRDPSGQTFTPTAVLAPPVAPTPYVSPSELDARLKAALPNARFLLPGASMSTMIGLTAAAERFHALFPKESEAVRGVAFRVQDPGTLATTTWRSWGSSPTGPLVDGTVVMTLSPRYFGAGSSDRVEVSQVNSVLNGWHVPEELGKEEVLGHEFGHVLHAVDPSLGDTPYDPVSRYGATDPRENMAEMYVQYAYGDPSTWAASTAQYVADNGWATPARKVETLEKASPLTFADRAKKVLQQGYRDAYVAGFYDTGLEEETQWDPEVVADLTSTESGVGAALVGLAALLVGGGITAALLDARLGQYAATLNSMYEHGYENGVEEQGTVTAAFWHKADDEACALCDERDGTTWIGDEPHPYPGEGYYGDVCEGGPNCRCELWYDLVPADAASPDAVDEADAGADDGGDVALGATSDLRKVSTATLLAARSALKYDPEQPRDWRGRWDAGDQLEDGKSFWVGDAANCRRMRDYLQSGADPKRYMMAGPARALLSAANRATPTTVPLYRGIPVSAGRAQYFADLKPGDKIDLNLSSWTENKYGAQGFAGNAHGTHDPQPGRDPIAGSVVFTLEPGAHALNLNDEVQRAHGEGGYYSFTESVAAGRFEVTGNSWDDRYGEVTLKQVATLAPPPTNVGIFDPRRAGTTAGTFMAAEADVLKYSEDQPRDERGRWTAGGGSDLNVDTPAWRSVGAEIERQGLGNCYMASATLMLNADRLGLRNPTIVQATAIGQGPIAGMPFGHSWLEADGPGGMRLAFDYSSGSQTVLPAGFYRDLGHVSDVHEFDYRQALEAMASTRHYGPWSDELPPNTGSGIPIL